MTIIGLLYICGMKEKRKVTLGKQVSETQFCFISDPGLTHACSVAQLCLTLRPHELQHARPPIHHQLLEFTQTYVH